MARLSGLLLVCLLVMAGEVSAGDTDVVAATLKDEASECRYLLKLCAEERKVRPCLEETTGARKKSIAEMERHTKEIEKATKEIRKGTPSKKSTTAQLHAKSRSLEERDNELRTRSLLCLADLTRTMNARHGAATVIRAKHDTLPSCFQECADVMDPSLYK